VSEASWEEGLRGRCGRGPPPPSREEAQLARGRRLWSQEDKGPVRGKN
jgi:hypothetical protein